MHQTWIHAIVLCEQSRVHGYALQASRGRPCTRSRISRLPAVPWSEPPWYQQQKVLCQALCSQRLAAALIADICHRRDRSTCCLILYQGDHRIPTCSTTKQIFGPLVICSVSPLGTFHTSSNSVANFLIGCDEPSLRARCSLVVRRTVRLTAVAEFSCSSGSHAPSDRIHFCVVLIVCAANGTGLVA